MRRMNRKRWMGCALALMLAVSAVSGASVQAKKPQSVVSLSDLTGVTSGSESVVFGPEAPQTLLSQQAGDETKTEAGQQAGDETKTEAGQPTGDETKTEAGQPTEKTEKNDETVITKAEVTLQAPVCGQTAEKNTPLALNGRVAAFCGGADSETPDAASVVSCTPVKVCDAESCEPFAGTVKGGSVYTLYAMLTSGDGFSFGDEMTLTVREAIRFRILHRDTEKIIVAADFTAVHNWRDSKVLREPTHTRTGIMSKVCTACGEKGKGVLPTSDTDVYVPETSWPMAAAVVWRADQSAIGTAKAAVRPAAAMVWVDAERKVRDRSGKVLSEELTSYLQATADTMIPVLYMEDGETVSVVKDWLTRTGWKDCFVAVTPENKALLAELTVLPQVYGILDASSVPSPDATVLAAWAEEAGAKVVLLDAAASERETVRTLQQAGKAVWAAAPGHAGTLFTLYTRGVNGVVTDDFASAIQAEEWFRDENPSLLRQPQVTVSGSDLSVRMSDAEAAGQRGLLSVSPVYRVSDDAQTVADDYLQGVPVLVCDRPEAVSTEIVEILSEDITAVSLEAAPRPQGVTRDGKRRTLDEAEPVPLSEGGSRMVWRCPTTLTVDGRQCGTVYLYSEPFTLTVSGGEDTSAADDAADASAAPDGTKKSAAVPDENPGDEDTETQEENAGLLGDLEGSTRSGTDETGAEEEEESLPVGVNPAGENETGWFGEEEESLPVGSAPLTDLPGQNGGTLMDAISILADDGYVPDGAVDDGYVTGGTANDGSVPDGTVDYGYFPDDTVGNGHVPNGTLGDGYVPNGTVYAAPFTVTAPSVLTGGTGLGEDGNGLEGNPDRGFFDESGMAYFVTQGENGSYSRGCGADYEITVNRSEDDDLCILHFTGVLVDGEALEKGTDYTVRPGSVILTLQASAIERLEDGTHDIRMVFDDGEAAALLTIVQARRSAGSDETLPSPGTGEADWKMLAILVMAASVFSLSCVRLTGKKRAA